MSLLKNQTWPAVRIHTEDNGSSGRQILVDLIVSIEARPGVWVPVFRKYVGGKSEVHVEDHVVPSSEVAECVRKALTVAERARRYRTDFVVEGEEDFPFDLLGVTQSWPTSPKDARLAGRALDGYPVRRITLTTHHDGSEPELHRPRWEAVEWRVVSVQTTPL